MLDFHKDINRGKVGEKIFEEDFLKFFGIPFTDVSKDKKYQKIDVDFVLHLGVDKLVDIKTNLIDDTTVIIEEYSDTFNKSGKPDGWFYKSQADQFVMINYKSKQMLFVDNNELLHNWYCENKQGYELQLNKETENKFTGRIWQSAFYRIPILDIPLVYSWYKKS